MRELPFADLTDEDLVADIQLTGNTAMFGELYRRFAPAVLSRAMSIVMNKAEAEDIAHDVFLKLYQNIHKYRRAGSFASWLNTFTYNFCLDHYRRQKRRGTSSLEFLPEQGESDMEMDTLSEKELLEIRVERLETYLAKLNGEERGILLMKYKDDMGVSAIATALKISESAVKMRLKRARDKVLSFENEATML